MDRRWILFVEGLARLEDTSLPKCALFGELVEGAGCVGGQTEDRMGCLLTTPELSVSTPTSRRRQGRTEGSYAKSWTKGRNISWQN